MSEDVDNVLRDNARRFNDLVKEIEKTQKRSSGVLDKSIRGLSSGFTHAHGSIEDFAKAMSSQLLVIGASGAVFGELVSSVFNLSKTYSKLTDAGQYFNGSMLTMAAQAGASGVSLEEFSRSIIKNSAVATALQHGTVGNINAFGQLQKSVRSSLLDVGQFGLSMSEINDATGDYAETLRLTGHLHTMNSKEQQVAITSLITDVSKFSEATGKSRKEILQGAMSFAKNPDTALLARLLTPEGMKRYIEANVAFSSIPGGGDAFKQFFIESVNARNTGMPIGTTKTGQALIEAGLPNVVALFEKFTNDQMTGKNPNKLEFMNNVNNSITPAQIANLERLGKIGAVSPLLYGLADSLKEANEAATKMPDTYTRFMLNIDHNFSEITGEFRKSFYEGILDSVVSVNSEVAEDIKNAGKTGSKEDVIAANKRMDDELAKQKANFVKSLQELGKTLGTAFGEKLKQFTDWLNHGGAAKLTEYASAFVDAIGNLASGIKRLSELSLEKIILAYIGYKVVGAAMTAILVRGTTIIAAGAASVFSAAILPVIAGIAAIAGIVALLAVGAAKETPETQAQKDKLSRERRSPEGGPNGTLHDGYDVEGRPKKHTGYKVSDPDPIDTNKETNKETNTPKPKVLDTDKVTYNPYDLNVTKVMRGPDGRLLYNNVPQPMTDEERRGAAILQFLDQHPTLASLDEPASPAAGKRRHEIRIGNPIQPTDPKTGMIVSDDVLNTDTMNKTNNENIRQQETQTQLLKQLIDLNIAPAIAAQKSLENNNLGGIIAPVYEP